MTNPFAKFVADEGAVNPFAKFVEEAPGDMADKGRPASETDLTQNEQMFRKLTNITTATPEEKLSRIRNRQGLDETVAEGLAGTAGFMSGGIPGAGLAVGMAKQATNKLAESRGLRDQGTLTAELGQAGIDVAVGLGEEVLGEHLLGPAFKTIGELSSKAVDAVSPMSGAVKRRASAIYNKMTPDGKVVSGAVSKGKELEQAIEGLKLSPGQLNKDYGTLKFEAGSDQDILQNKIEMKNLQVIDEYLNDAKGKGNLKVVIERLEKRGLTVDKNLYAALDNLDRLKGKYNPTVNKEASGRVITEQADKLQANAVKEYGEAFDLDERPIVPITKVLNNARNILASGSDIKLKKNIPAIVKKFTDVFGKEGEEILHVSPSQIQKMRSDVTDEIRNEVSGKNNRKKVRDMTEFLKSLDKALDDAAPLLSKELDDARKAYKVNVVDKFYNSTIGDVLNYTDGSRLHPAQVMSKFFKGGEGGVGVKPMQDFLRVFGDDPAMMKEMTDHIDNLMVTQASDPSTGIITGKKLMGFLKKHRDALEEAGLFDRYNSVQKASSMADNASDVLKNYQKSEAYKLLGIDPGLAVKKVFSSGKKTKVAEELMSLVGSDANAKQGLQDAIIDHIAKESSGRSVTFDKLMDEFGPVYETIFSGKAGQDKLKIMYNYQEALSRLSEGERGKFFGGDLLAREKFVSSFIKGERVTGNQAVAWLSGIKALAQTFSNSKVVSLLKEAAINPDAALALKMMGTKTPDEMSGKFKALIGGITARTVGESVDLSSKVGDVYKQQGENNE